MHVLDRFQFMQRMNKAIDQVRAAEVKQLRQDGYEPILKGCRWLLLKGCDRQPANTSGNLDAQAKAGGHAKLR